jgi:hypothetical protein
VAILGAFPYIIQIIRGRTKPRIVTWFTWSLLTGIACAASFSTHDIPSAILTLASMLVNMTIVVLGFKHGDRHFERLDVFCQLAAFVGLALWFLFNSPAIAVSSSIAIDAVGAIPTLKHSWKRPYEETWISFLLGSIAGVLTTIVAASWSITAVAYPLYLAIANALLVALILLSPHRAVKVRSRDTPELEPAE